MNVISYILSIKFPSNVPLILLWSQNEKTSQKLKPIAWFQLSLNVIFHHFVQECL